MSKRSVITNPSDVVYVILHVDDTGNVMNVSDSSIVAYVDANYLQYVLQLTQAATGGTLFEYTVPSGLVPGTYREEFRRCAGGAPASTNAVTNPLVDGFIKENVFAWNGAAVTGSASTGANQATVGELRSILQTSARNLGLTLNGTDTYSLAEQDRAITGVLEDFIEHAHISNTQYDTFTLAAAANTAALTIPGFTGDYVQNIWLIPDDATNTSRRPPLNRVSWEEIVEECNPSQTGYPCKIAIPPTTGTLTAYFDKTADVQYDGTIKWKPPLLSWTAGAVDGTTTSTIINIRGSLARPAVRWGGSAFLQGGVVSNKEIADAYWAKYLQHRTDSMGKGGEGIRSIRREPIEVLRRERRY